MQKPEGIIFDLDGTLVDSAPLYTEALVLSLERNSTRIAPEEISRLLLSMKLTTDLMALGISETKANSIADNRDREVIELFSTRTKWMPGAERFSGKIASIMPSSIVTNAWKTTVDAIHLCTHIRDRFRIVVDGDTVNGKFKPDPHGLLLAAEAMGTPPKTTLYIGNREMDFTAAKAAGMRSCLFGSDDAKIGEDRPEICVQSWNRLEEILL
ncbi:MAG: HAD family hydrolase [Candidatus Peribacteraceae bacterium]|nr:HAD family hydrolase [Candidatus Peribacteraceae bacterium]